jgi:hypothetical protein
MKKNYRGSCHCGAVRFEAYADLAEGTVKCNYQFGSKTIHHRFCKRCGLRPFSHGNPGGGDTFYAVNVACLDDVDIAELVDAPVIVVDGRNDDFKNPPPETRHL